MTIKSADLHIGTSGWSYKHWVEIFYPKDIKPEKYLEYYITRFDCVELNSSFYNLPRETTVTGWMNRTPDTFRFCPKLSRFITHQMQLVNIEIALHKFFDVFEGMKNRLGPVLIQLPPGLSYDKPLICNFLNLLKEHYNQYRFAVEVRNKSWTNDSFFGLLSQFGISFVIADSGNRYPYFEAVTTDFIYLRFHGREQLYASDYSENVLKSYAEKITVWLNEGKEVWVFFNNDYYGYAVNNADKLKKIIY
ncbi:MAG: DUF72 domain-containing protein [Bacteroidia bacterium]|jgi:uncharacterized protein YecE (DUF72 family)|nr:DUF72 domain-containing protein [Bacteroidia bacterium]